MNRRPKRKPDQFEYVEVINQETADRNPLKQSEYKESPGRVPNFTIDVIGIPIVLGFFAAIAWIAWTEDWGRGIAVGAVVAGFVATYRTFFVLDRISPKVHTATWGDPATEDDPEQEPEPIPASWSLVTMPTGDGQAAAFYQPRAGALAAWLSKVIRDYEAEGLPFGEKANLSERTAIRKEGWLLSQYQEMIGQFQMLGLVHRGRNRVPEPTAKGIRVFKAFLTNNPPAPVING